MEWKRRRHQRDRKKTHSHIKVWLVFLGLQVKRCGFTAAGSEPAGGAVMSRSALNDGLTLFLPPGWTMVEYRGWNLVRGGVSISFPSWKQGSVFSVLKSLQSVSELKSKMTKTFHQRVWIQWKETKKPWNTLKQGEAPKFSPKSKESSDECVGGVWHQVDKWRSSAHL